MSAKWPRWFVPICISKPSAVCACGMFITPALLISTSMSSVGPVREGADRREVGQVEPADLGVALDLGGGALALRVSRTARTTWAPAAPSARAASKPMPLLAPVMTKVRPVWSGRSATVHFCEVMPTK